LSHDRNRGHGRIVCTLTDTSKDGDAVYVAWNSDNYPGWRSIYNRNGSGTGEPFKFERERFLDGGHMLEWKVCRDRQAPWTDNCSGTHTWRF
jgi:hypothetical protein